MCVCLCESVCVCEHLHVCVVLCFLLLTIRNMNIKCQTLCLLSLVLYKMHMTVHPFITVSCVHERHLSNTV